MDKKDFIVGKYYKQIRSKYKFIAKFASIREGDSCFMSDGEYIYEGKLYTARAISSDWKNAVECPYEEYSKYLPAGHVDLKHQEEYITNLISGEIYVAENKAIFQHQSDNNAAYYFGYGNTTFEKNGGNFIHKKDRLATKEEKQWLDACIKANKFIPKEEALKSISSELTSLPEKWFITVTSQNIPELTKFKISKGKDEVNGYKFVCHKGYGYGDRNYVDKVGVEISTDQFRKWVLKESPNTISPSIEEDWSIDVFDNSDLGREVREYLNSFIPSGKVKYTGGDRFYGKKLGKLTSDSNSYWGKLLTTEQFYAKINKSIPNKEENLVGRWLKVLENYPCGGNVKKGEEGQIIRHDSNYLEAKFPSQSNYACTSFLNINKYKFELMSPGWSPEAKNSSVISKEALLEEAKRRFPIDCKFYSITEHDGLSTSIYTNRVAPHIYESDGDFWIIGSANIYCNKTKQWAKIISSPKQESRIEVFNGIFVGDIAVSHSVINSNITERKGGDIFLVLEKSSKNNLYYKNHASSSETRDWRKATTEETEWYNKGVRNINDIPKNESILDKWLRETRAMNLSLSNLENRIGLCDYYNVYILLDGFQSPQKAKILHEKWYGTKGETPQNLENIFKYPISYGDAYYIGVDPYRSTELLSLDDKGGLIDTSVRKTKSIKRELVELEQVTIF